MNAAPLHFLSWFLGCFTASTSRQLCKQQNLCLVCSCKLTFVPKALYNYFRFICLLALSQLQTRHTLYIDVNPTLTKILFYSLVTEVPSHLYLLVNTLYSCDRRKRWVQHIGSRNSFRSLAHGLLLRCDRLEKTIYFLLNKIFQWTAMR